MIFREISFDSMQWNITFQRMSLAVRNPKLHTDQNQSNHLFQKQKGEK